VKKKTSSPSAYKEAVITTHTSTYRESETVGFLRDSLFLFNSNLPLPPPHLLVLLHKAKRNSILEEDIQRCSGTDSFRGKIFFFKGGSNFMSNELDTAHKFCN